jgi:tRNA(Arg) A34 adenosine deaminase TadA
VKRSPDKMVNDKKLLIRALDVAMAGIQKGGGPFGAVITRNGEIIAEGFNEVVTTKDPTAHAEIVTIRKACKTAGSHDLSDCTLYASCEPCPMCLGAIYWSGIKRIFYASDRKDAARAGFGDDFFYEEILKTPDQRKISFCQLPEVNGSEVFKMWDRYENKIPY